MIIRFRVKDELISYSLPSLNGAVLLDSSRNIELLLLLDDRLLFPDFVIHVNQSSSMALVTQEPW